MSDVMISYSRKDVDFVRSLHQRLATQGRDVWVDFEDIPKTADWWNEIKGGIDAANNFVFVISPDSAVSEVCGWEVQHAAASQKRIVPVLRRDITDPAQRKQLHPSIRAHNWIYAREGDDLELAMTELVKALDTDLDYVRAHTRLLIRAKEWDDARRDPSLLMNGTELTNAEALLARAVDKQPSVAPLQEQYVRESRRVVRTRSRVILSVAVFVVVVTLLTVVSIWQAVVANQNRAEAERNAASATIAQGQAVFAAGTSDSNAASATVAQGRAVLAAATSNAGQQTAIAAQRSADRARLDTQRLALASNALIAYSNLYYDLALALALEANRGGMRLQTEGALAAIAYQPGTRRLMAAVNGYLYAVSVTADGEHVLAGGCLHQDSRICQTPYVALFDLNTGDLVRTYDTAALTASTNFELLASPGADVFAITDSSNVTLARQDGVPLYTLTAHNEFIQALAFSPDGGYLLTGDLSGRLILWDTTTGEEVRRFALESGVRALAFAPDGVHFMVGTMEGWLYYWDASADQPAYELYGHDGAVVSLSFNPDGTRLVSSGFDGAVYVWDVEAGVALISYGGHKGFVNALAFLPNGVTVLSASDDTRVQHWNVDTGQTISVLAGHRDSVSAVAVHPSGQYAISASFDGGLRLWDLNSAQLVQVYQDEHSVAGMVFNQNTGRAVTALGSGQLRVWNVQDGSRDLLINTNIAYLYPITLAADGQTVLTGGQTDDGSGGYGVWDITSGRALFRVDGLNAGITAVALGPDGARGAYGDWNGGITVFDSADGSALYTVNMHLDQVNGLVFSPDGTRLYSAGYDSYVYEWNVSDGAMVAVYPGVALAPTSLALSPDGARLLAGMNNGEIFQWSTRTRTLQAVYRGHISAVYALAFSGDGKTFVSGSADFTVRVWDIETGLEARAFTGHGGPVTGVQFNAQGSSILSAGVDGTIRLWRFERLDSLLQWTYANRYVYNLSCLERWAYGVTPFCDSADTAPPPHVAVVPGAAPTQGALPTLGAGSALLLPATTNTPTLTPTLAPTVGDIALPTDTAVATATP